MIKDLQMTANATSRVNAGSSVRLFSIFLGGALSLSAPIVLADDDEELEIRVQRIEQVVNNRQQLDIVNRLNDLQQQVEMLHGEMDVQKQNLHQLTERQHLLFQDLDHRVAAMEKGGKPAATSSATASPVAAAPVAPAQTTPTNTMATAPANAASPNTAPTAATTPTTPPAPVVAASPQQDQAAYQQSYQHLLDKQYPQAIEAFTHYLRDYPQGRYRPNAYYWLGEVYLIQNQPNEAQQAFNTVIKDYPQNTKVGDAMLKLGYAYVQMGDITKAKSTFTEVTQKYPNTAIAGLAQSKLTELP